MQNTDYKGWPDLQNSMVKEIYFLIHDRSLFSSKYPKETTKAAIKKHTHAQSNEEEKSHFAIKFRILNCPHFSGSSFENLNFYSIYFEFTRCCFFWEENSGRGKVRKYGMVYTESNIMWVKCSEIRVV